MDHLMFFHGTTTDRYRFTICGIFKKNSPALSLGISVCSTNDIFNKKRGRCISVGRLLCERSEVRGRISELPIVPLKDNAYTKSFIDAVSVFNTYTRNALLTVFQL